MPIGRRLSTLLVVLALVAAPAIVLRLFCVGRSCDAGEAEAQASVPFCPLPPELRRQIAAGFREGRSPDVMAVTNGVDAVATEIHDSLWAPWPGAGSAGAAAALPDTRVPIAFFGGGVNEGSIPDGVGLDAIAPTLEAIAGIHREHPDVRTGVAIEGLADGAGSPLIVLIAWKGIGTTDLGSGPGAWRFLRGALREGAGTLEAETGSLPVDPAATLTTIGTGGLPSSHGITGTFLREDDGDVQRAWSTSESGSVIATFADDLDRGTSERALIAGVLSAPADRGLIGNGWYLDAGDRDTVIQIGQEPRHAAVVSREIVTSEGVGRDDVTDVLGVVLDGSLAEVDRGTADVVTTIRELVPEATFVVAGTGSLRSGAGDDAAELATNVDASLGVPVVEGTAADGFFLDRGVMVEGSLTAQQVADELRRERSRSGDALFDDVYPSFAVAFSRYC